MYIFEGRASRDGEIKLLGCGSG